MNIVTPTSRLFENQEVAARISQLSDSVEARPELNVAIPPSAKVSHCHVSAPRFDLNMLWSDLDKKDLLTLLSRFLDSLPVISFHLARDCVDVGLDEHGRYIPKSSPLAPAELLENCMANVAWLREEVDSELLVENNNFHDTGAYEISTSPSFISSVLDSCDLGLLFDSAHAAVSAHNLGIPETQYVEALPLERTKQVHVSGHTINRGKAVDAHNLPDLGLVLTAINLSRERTGKNPPITIEYYKDGDALLDLLARIRASQSTTS